MEKSVKIFNSANRQLSNALVIRGRPLQFPSRLTCCSPSSSFPLRCPPVFPCGAPPLSFSLAQSNCHCSIFPHSSGSSCVTASFFRPSFSSPNSVSLGLNSVSAPQSFDSLIFSGRFARIFFDSESKSFDWNFASKGEHDTDIGIIGDKEPLVTVVLLGWLGSKRKHLRKYVEFYNSRGINAITFVTSVTDVLSFNMERKLENRVSGLTDEIVSWLSETDKDGRERFLLIHTFSNTGWITYGAILQFLQERQDLLGRIKGCVADSGPEPDLNPKKNSSAAYSPVHAGEGNLESGVTMSKIQEKKPLLTESFLLAAFEKFFSFFISLPHFNKRLMEIIYTLTKNQPPCPQLYLYSTADKVIPFRSVESFMEEQRRMGRQVRSFNFGLSPHVDHYRTYPDSYESQLQKFLKECLAAVKQRS